MTKKKTAIIAVLLMTAYSVLMFAFGTIMIDTDRLHFHWDGMTAAAYSLSVLYLTVITLFCFIRVHKERFSIKRMKNVFEFIIVPLISLCIIIYSCGAIVNSSTVFFSRRDILIIQAVSLLLCLTSVVLSERISRSRELKMQNMLMQKEQELYRRHICEADGYIREISSIRHDIKNKLLCLSEMLNDNRISEAQVLCGRMEDELCASSYVFASGNVYLNSILNVLYRKAGISHTDIKVLIKSELSDINGEDIITIIGNLGDNALESGASDIGITITEKGGYYIITIKNNIESSVLKENPDLHTTKADHSDHGHGIRSVKATAKKYNGELRFFESDGQFVASVMLEIPTATEIIPTATKV